jgi:hypothetical protein
MNIKTLIKMSFISSCVFLLASCDSIPLEPGADTVRLSDTPPNSACRYIGDVQSTIVNGRTAAYTTDKNLNRMANNELRNKTYDLGGNYVYITKQATGYTTLRGNTRPSDQVIGGQAYFCPTRVL